MPDGLSEIAEAPRRRPDAADFLAYARLMNGVCPSCGTINAQDGTPRCECEERSDG